MQVALTINSHVCFDYRPLQKKDRKTFVRICNAFTHANQKFYQTQRMGYATTGIPRRIKSYKITKDEIKVSRGGFIKLKKILKKYGHEFTVTDERLKFPIVNFRSRIKLNPEQVEPVKMMLEKGQGLVRGPCSSGKTVMLLEAIARARQPALVIVWETNKQKEWIAEIKKFYGIPESQIGGCGGVFKKRKFGKINVCMQQSLWREENRDFFFEKCGTLAADEVQRFAAKTFQEAVNPSPAKYRWGVSAKEKRKDGMHFLIYDTFGKILHEVPEVETGSRKKAKIVMIPTEFESQEYLWNNNWTQLINSMSEDEGRNKLILKRVRRSLEKGKFVLILTERRSHALWFRFALQDQYKTAMLLGNISAKDIRTSGWPKAWKEYVKNLDNDAEFVRVKELGEKRELDVVIATQKGDVGISIRTLDHLHITTPTGNDIERFNQQKGRIEREFPGKETPRVYYYWDVNMEKLREAGNKIIKAYPGVSVLKVK